MAPCYPQPMRRRKSPNVNVMRRKKKTYVRRRSLPTRVHKFALANINPFNRDCYGARIPDDSTVPSSPFYTYDTVRLNLGTSAPNSLLGCVFIPSVDYGCTSAVAGVGANITWPNYGGAGNIFNNLLQVSNKQNIKNNYTMYRTVSHGIRLACPGTLVGTTGNIHIALVPFEYNSIMQNNTIPFQLPKNIPEISQMPGYRKIPLAELCLKPLIVVNRFCDETAFRYSETNYTWYDSVYTDVSKVPQSSGTVTTDLTGLWNNISPGLFNFPMQWMSIVVFIENGPGGGFTGSQSVS